jgi:uncharacterized BrkB/YihY/UPF0761 family membrane protein
MSTPEPNLPQRPAVPTYGEYAEPAQQPQPQYGEHPYYAPHYDGKPPFRTADLIVSIILLFVGLLVTLGVCATALQLGPAMQQQYDAYELGAYTATSTLAIAQALIIASHLLLLVIAIPVTIVLINKRKISFWLPLTAGALAAIVFWIAITVLVALDPQLMNAMQYPG